MEMFFVEALVKNRVQLAIITKIFRLQITVSYRKYDSMSDCRLFV